MHLDVKHYFSIVVMDRTVSDDEASQAPTDTVKTGCSLTEEHISEMECEDSEELYFYWKKLKTYEHGCRESLAHVEHKEKHAKARTMRYKKWCESYPHCAIKPWNLREMSHGMRCHLYKTWQDIENHKVLADFCEAEEPEFIDGADIDSYCYLHRPAFRKLGWQTGAPASFG